MRTKPQWTENKEFCQIAKRIVSDYPEQYGKIDPDWIVAYTTPGGPSIKSGRGIEMTGTTEPESFTNTKKYFVKMWLEWWMERNAREQRAVVMAFLDFIDPNQLGVVRRRDSCPKRITDYLNM